MLSPESTQKIETLRFDPHAALEQCWLPWGGVYWSDELPPEKFQAFPGTEWPALLQVFLARVLLWKGEALTPELEAAWNEARQALPKWPIFQRLTVSPEILQRQLDTEECADECFDALFGDAEEFECHEIIEGVVRYSGEFKL